VVEQILVAECQPEDPLRDQRPDLMHDIDRAAPVTKASREPIHQTDRLVRLAEQQSPGIRGHHAAVEISDNTPAASPSKIDLCRATLCRHRGITSNQANLFSQNKFTL